MLVTGNYEVARERCQIVGNIDISTNENLMKFITDDINRSSFISLDMTFDDFKHIWLNEYHHVDNNKYEQGRLEGSIIPGNKMRSFRQTIMMNAGLVLEPEELDFSFYNDNNNLCSFSLRVLLDCPAIWFAVVTVNTTAPSAQRPVMVFIPEYTDNLLTNLAANTKNININELYNQVAIDLKIDEPILVNMESLNEYLGYALNSLFIKQCLANLFDKQGNIQLDHFKALRQSLEHKCSMFKFPDEKIQEMINQGRLSQICAVLTKMMHASGSIGFFQPLIQKVKGVMENYSLEEFNEIVQHPDIKRFENELYKL